jgi:hypothetical protein
MVLEQIDLRRVPVLLALLGAGMFLATLLVRPGPLGSERYEAERRSRRQRTFALRGMLLMTLTGLVSGLSGGLLQGATGGGALALALHALYRLCWLPAYVLRDVQWALLEQGITALDGTVFDLLGLLLIPVAWFLVFFGASRWLPDHGKG